MPNAARDTYLETQVLTATPQRLRLMLIEGAIRFGRQALDCWDDESRRQQQCAALGRCNEILTELFNSVEPELPPAQRTMETYRFLLVQLALVSSHDDEKALQDVIGVLEVEQETWRQVCEAMPEAPAAPQTPKEISAVGMGSIAPGVPGPNPGPVPGTDRLSLEA